MTLTETWKPVTLFPDSYLVSNTGKIKSITRNVIRSDGKGLPVKERILRSHISSSGYEKIGLNGKGYMVHRLVAEAFLLNPENKSQVNHVNGIKTDNTITNLEWCTPSENINHAVQTGLHAVGEDKSNSKLKESDIPEIFKLRIKGLSCEEIGRRYNVDHTLIHNILNRKTWKHVPVILSFLFVMLSVTTGRSQAALPDTSCYTKPELEKIAARVVRADECDTLLINAEQENQNLLCKMEVKDKEITNLNQESKLKETIITGKDTELITERSKTKKLSRAIKWVKAGWVTTTAVLGGLLTYVIITD